MGRTRSIPLAACLVSMALLGAQSPPSLPEWLSPYPGSREQTRQMGAVVESNYTVAAQPREVLSHFRRLFAAAGVRFDPSAGGNGFLIHAGLPECDLYIQIRRMDAGAAVHVTCAAGPGREQAQRTQQQAEESSRKHIDAMEKFDRPVYPQPKQPAPPMPPLAWPAWLVRIDGARLDVQKGIDGVRMHYLKSSFLCSLPRNEIQAHYADLLDSHGYRIYLRSLDTTPANRKAWIEGAQHFEGRAGRRMVIRIDLIPVNDLITVDLRMTVYP